MTDTGQVPGEGLPENAGMVEQPGAPAHGAYTYLSETTAEDEDLLLLPGAQGAWGNEVAPPPPEPVVETVHEPGPHEMSGRDSGSVDLGGVRLPDSGPQSMPVAPRRPLHLGPPIPDTSASPVRSLADRGAVGAPVRQSGLPATGVEYLDAPQQLREMSPQGATPWGAAPVQGAVQAPVSPEAAAAETVVPAPVQEAEPVGAAQAAVTRLATEAGTATAPQAEDTVPASEPAQTVGDGFGAEAAEPAEPAEGQGDAVAQAQESQNGAVAQVPDDQDAGFAQADAQGDAMAQASDGQDAGFAQAPPVPDPGGLGAPTAEVHALTAEVQEGGYAEEAPQGGAVAPGGEAGFDGDVPQFSAETHALDAEQMPETVQVPDAEQVPVTAPLADEGQALGVVQDEAAGAVAAAEPEQAAALAVDGGQTEGVSSVADAGQEQGVDALAEAGHDLVTDAGQPPAADLAVESEPVLEAAPAPDAVEGPEAVHIAEADPASEIAPVSEAVAPDIAPGFETATGQPATAEPGTAGADTSLDAAQIPAPDAFANAAQFPEAAGQGAVPYPEAAGQNTVPFPEAATQDAVQPLPSEAQVVEHAQTAPEAVPFPAAAEAAQAPQHVDGSTAPVEEVPAAVTPEPSPQYAAADQAAPEQSQVPLADAQPVQDVQGPQLVPDASLAHEGTADPVATAAELPEAQPRFEAPDTMAPAPEPHVDQPLGQFVQVEGSVPTTPHLAPTPPHAMTLPPEDPQAPEPVAAVPAPREGDPALVQHAEDLDTRAADQDDRQDRQDRQNQQDRQDQEEMSTAPVEDVRQSTGPAAPAYEDAEREAVLKVMRERRDIRNGFRSDPIPHEVLLRVLEAAHTAPSVGHSQPWDFVVIRSAETRSGMHELAMRQRDAYAKSLPKGRAKQFKELKIEAILDTPVNIVVTADPTRGGRHTLGRHTQPQMAPYSAALAVENLWLAARAEGLGVGWVSFFDEREMVRALGLPEHLEVIAYLCVGYVDEFPDEPELMQAGWSKRRPLSWVVHEEMYGRRALPGEEPHDLLGETVAQIRPLDAKALGEAWERQKRMTKPAGALGMLEIISAQLSGLSRQCPPPIPEPAAVAIFAGDHGVHAQGVTPWPQEVTAQMVANFLGGGAVCNAFAAQVGAEVCVVDVGVAADLPATPGLLPRKVRAGTSDMTTGPAMTREEAKQAIEVGIDTARDLVAAGNKALLTGEMGIANTTASAALISVFTDTDPADVTGRGTGINDETLARKTEVVRRAIELHQPDPADPIGVLAAIGGFEHAAIVGLLLGGASLRTPVILDGVSAGAAALVARAIAPEVLAACIAGHRSAEPGHVAALNKLGLRPLVDLDLRLGEGTGALLALPLVQSTARAMHEVATFDSAGVTEK
ncbi:nicotinate-nucleotide--dimethylbenzimidazole phosphoribosyltransferase [Streptomyces sp. MMG1533]|uniref:nicotinate-nucleotide--dimethylbenzimidazole phosphoribosyltransferase n=1 Tax=Streptomyces sp. MMG1533 TaxID=1415546 RepID=UPI0006AEDE6B|nr:nicotinate-nucleotide--dimethylbenzimidazole phosphoribosyltransferase [Streptomyces sp. MMG1533]KOU74432.1 nicotinate-nucleotide--dimethylbenzimidazole phosphoribosyltransferase [Streptomyces sp. MMG1533]